MGHILSRIRPVRQQFNQPAGRNIGPYHDYCQPRRAVPRENHIADRLARVGGEATGIDGEDEYVHLNAGGRDRQYLFFQFTYNVPAVGVIIFRS